MTEDEIKAECVALRDFALTRGLVRPNAAIHFSDGDAASCWVMHSKETAFNGGLVSISPVHGDDDDTTRHRIARLWQALRALPPAEERKRAEAVEALDFAAQKCREADFDEGAVRALLEQVRALAENAITHREGDA